jgi:hypothetical protein
MSVNGSWRLVVDSPMGKQDILVQLKEDDGRLTGTLINKGNDMASEIFDGTVENRQLQWKVKLQKLKMTVSFTTTVDGDTMAGKAKAGMFGSFSVLGERTEE